jgi:hypothetical protein
MARPPRFTFPGASYAITGKIEVCEAARLPDEAEETLGEADVLSDAEEDPTEDLKSVPEEAET